MHPTDLPIYQQRERILDALSDHQVVVVESPTGSGKTTQIPQILLASGYADSGIIGVTQPRRIAAVSVSQYIAAQLGKKIPDTVGYKMRFEDMTDAGTRIKIMTDGILLQEMKADYFLSRYSVIMVDEAHERSLNIDFILGLLKRVLKQRREFKVMVSSATINAEIFSEYFDECPIVKIDAITYPVETIYAPLKAGESRDDVIPKIGEIVSKTVKAKKKGDILIFLSGQRDIKECLAYIDGLECAPRLKLLPLYGRLTSEEQERVFPEYPGKRKIIAATNIAETSVTIDGVGAVIDPGLAKMNFYNQNTFTSSLVEVPISRASCNQRKGRAGRTAPGVCYRLYDRNSYESRPLFTQEEILRTDLSEVVLRMAELGIQDFESFDFISPPGREGIISAIETLRLLNALDEKRSLTNIGLMMVRFPMLPKHSRMIVEAIRSYPQVVEEVITAASFLTTNSPFLLPMGQEMEAREAHHSFRDAYGDFVSYLKIHRAYRSAKDREKFCSRYFLDREAMDEILNIKAQIEEIVSEIGVPILSGGSLADYLCAVSTGLIQFVCVRSGKRVYRSLTAQQIQIHPGSVMFQESPEYIVAGEIVRTTRMYARSVSRLRPDWLARISPLLQRSLARGAAARQKAGARDYTNQIKIGIGVFPIVKEKGKKTVLLPWKELKQAMRGIELRSLADYKNLRGKILLEGKEMLSGARLSTILGLVDKLHPEKGILSCSEQRSYRYPDEMKSLSRSLNKLLSLCPRKKKSRQLGFLALYREESGSYKLKAARNFHTAVAESLANLENLSERLSSLGGYGGVRKSISQAYHRLNQVFEGG
jgi:RNA helicase HrpA